PKSCNGSPSSQPSGARRLEKPSPLTILSGEGRNGSHQPRDCWLPRCASDVQIAVLRLRHFRIVTEPITPDCAASEELERRDRRTAPAAPSAGGGRACQCPGPVRLISCGLKIGV